MASETSPAHDTSELGINSWLVDELHQAYLSNPSSVDEGWRDFFREQENSSGNGAGTSPAVTVPTNAVATTPAATEPAPAARPAPIDTRVVPSPVLEAPLAAPRPALSPPSANDVVSAPTEVAVPLRGAAGRIVSNMTQSLGVPTATSVHPLPAKIIELNRALINEHLAHSRGGKVSFTHLIAWAIIRSVAAVPALNSSFVDDVDGKNTPGVIRHDHVGLGIAIDVERPDGSRSLLVPAIKRADMLDFAGFVEAYEDLVRRARTGKLAVDDFSGVTLTITNPGTLGTTQSVPRLMSGQGAIIGVGALDYPPEYGAAHPDTIRALGVGKVLTLTSTYDHRIIQGAESGLFLKYAHELLVGEHSFYDEVFLSLQVPTQPARWQRDQSSLVDSDRRESELQKELQVQSLIHTYRVRGHLMAQLDPLSSELPRLRPDLDPQNYGLSVWDYDREFLTGGVAGKDRWTLRELMQILRDAYCFHIGVEYMHIQDSTERKWVQEHVEGVTGSFPATDQRYILDRLTAAEVFEHFLHSRYIGQKRFGLEGGESTIPFIDATFEESAKAGLVEAVIGMAHRGRLNVLANIVGKSYAEIFAEFEGNLDPESVQGSGDVKYHKGAAGKWIGRDGLSLLVTMASNPSHLEAVDPVVEGIARAKLDRTYDPDTFAVMPLLIHGDASFAGQGVVAETLNMSMLDGYRVGGTIHLVINNQVGFTTSPTDARSTVYATDVARMVQAPIFHVNGDDPEACVRVARLAVAYREAFHKDVVVDLVCYRLHGHNEGDDPSYTQPLMYKKIDVHDSVRTIYTNELVRRGDLSAEEAEQVLAELSSRLQLALDETRLVTAPRLEDLSERVRPAPPRFSAETGVPRPELEALTDRMHTTPEGFTVHPKLERQLEQRRQLFLGGEVDWALGEALAFGSILLEGHDVRLSGQDSQRGTFSHRHSVLVDYDTGAEFTPLTHLDALPGSQSSAIPGRFFVHDSLLSEYAALGFEYGYSLEAEDALVCWEAQFGDFANGAQIIIDNFIAAAEEKWGQTSRIVMLLPHGYEGQGPEHSSARIERYLMLSAQDNLTIAQPTTASQYFHLLRSQSHHDVPRPLIVITPKSLLRARQSRSTVDQLVNGRFEEVVDDPSRSNFDVSSVSRVVCSSGKIAFDAISRRDAIIASGRDPQTAILRVEQLSPWPEDQINAVLSRYRNANELVWLQDEPENMGAWNYAHERLHRLDRDRFSLRHVSRQAAGSPATGSHLVHEWELEHLLSDSVGEVPASS